MLRNVPNRMVYLRCSNRALFPLARSTMQNTFIGYKCDNGHIHKHFSSMNPNDFIATSLIDSATFEVVCSDTLESLCDYFEQLVEDTSSLTAADVTYGVSCLYDFNVCIAMFYLKDGVLTVNFGPPHGTYVINRQSPNRQIWLSSPTSGPKRYDFVPDKTSSDEGCWVYKHDGISLHELLQREIKIIVEKEVDFFSLPHSKRK